MKNKNFTTRINFSGDDFQNEFNGFNKSLPTWEEVSTLVETRHNEEGEAIWSSHMLSKIDRQVIESNYRESK